MFAMALRSVVAATIALGIAALMIAAPMAVDAALAQSIDAETIVRALTPKPRSPATRSFKPGGQRGIDIQEGDTAEEPAPSIDLYVHFELDQSALTMSDARITVDTLGQALKDRRLASMSFEIIGHTDARGTDEYNLKLSRDRAEAVRSRLIQFHGVDAGKLKAEGRGKRELKDPSRPEHEVNRRVQIRTVADKTSYVSDPEVSRAPGG
jgi:outer membrane protein OmpA-like peptidoglycan-associated protein